jgi:hypothetical protein
MGTLAAVLLGLTGSIAARVLTSLGIGIISYAALSTLAATVVASVTSNYNLLDPVIFNLLNLAGAGQAMGILCAAMITRASLQAIKKLRVL